jgi:hypothetical protein
MKKILILVLACFLCLSGCTKPNTSVDEEQKQETVTEPNHDDKDTSSKDTEKETDIKDAEQNASQDKEKPEYEELQEDLGDVKTDPQKDKEIVSVSPQTKDEIKQEAEKNEDAFSVAYLGTSIGNLKNLKNAWKQNGVMDVFPFIADIETDHFISQQGKEVYLVIPNENVRLDVYRAEIGSNGKMKVTKRLGSFNEPFILQGNISDIVPSFFIKAFKDKKLMAQYSPTLSLKDGKVTAEEGVHDVTPYEKLNIE